MGKSIKTVANTFLYYSFNRKIPISPLKLQKLVYFLHGWHLAIREVSCIDGKFEVWPYGPVNENLYHFFKGYGNKNITDYAYSWKEKESEESVAYIVSRNNADFYKIFDAVFDKYINLSVRKISSLTHLPGSPRDKTKNESGISAIIDDDLIKGYFRRVYHV